MIPPDMRHFRKHNPIVLTLSHLRARAFAGAAATAIALFASATGARADLLIDYGSTVVWNGGFATNTGGGWYGQGWDRFPGVNPPWNPVNRGCDMGIDDGFAIARSYRASLARPMPTPEVRVVIVPVREPRPVRPLSLSFNGEDVPLSGCVCGW